jgi:hypothetical protein
VLGEGDLIADADAPARVERALCPPRVAPLEALEERRRVERPPQVCPAAAAHAFFNLFV